MFSGCKRELNDARPQIALSADDLTKISEAYQPDSNTVGGLLDRFQVKKNKYLQGLKSDLGDLPLSEAIWITEADLNFLRGDARIPNDELLVDSIEVDVPYFLGNGGEVRVQEVDLLAAHQAVLALLPDSALANGIRYIDVFVFGVDPTNAKLHYVTYRRAVAQTILPPPPTGCFWMDHPSDPDAHEVMNYYLAYYEQLAIGTNYPRPYYVSISAESYVSPLNGYGLLNGYTVYLGTDDALGGPDWLESGTAGTQVCFPAYWQRHLLLRQWLFNQFAYVSGRVLIREEYEANFMPPTSLTPMDYGSPYYPMGPYDHLYKFRRAILSRYH